jgi:hypothetical protein
VVVENFFKQPIDPVTGQPYPPVIDPITGNPVPNGFDASGNYDGSAAYTMMGITIPKIVDVNNDGINDAITTTNSGELSDTVETAYQKFLAAVAASLRVDPLIIDLNNDGIIPHLALGSCATYYAANDNYITTAKLAA